ncbi:hypothetical protein A4X13_0g2440 [Tilletia indica]|uniref:Mid2 domain-containing protein n=1 Tax=Tilletia indica TaxID=43049 RepID=A0A177TG60_9BASI|nr:hypothetical protein A4X13_0g2440 [Tilletia indica]
MPYPSPTPAPRSEDIAAALQEREPLLGVINGVTSLVDGVLTVLGLTTSTTFTVIGSSTILPTNLTSTQTTSSRSNDTSTSSSSSSSSMTTTSLPTESIPTESTSTADPPSSTSQDETSTPVTETSTTVSTPTTTEEPTSTSTQTRTTTDRDEPTSTRTRSSEAVTSFTTTSSLSFSVSGTQTFTQVVVVTIPAGVASTPGADRNSSSSNGGTIGGVVGGVVGGLALLAFILAALFIFKRRKDRTGKGWFLCFGSRPGSRRGSKATGGTGGDDTWPTFDPTANTGSETGANGAFGSTHRDPFRNEPTLPNIGTAFEDDDIENPTMSEYHRCSYGVPAAAAAAAAGGYYARSPTQQSFYPQSSLNSHGNMAPASLPTAPSGTGSLGMYPDDAAAQSAYMNNAGRAVSPGPGGAGGLSAHSHGTESFANDYSHLDPPDVRAQRGAEAATAAAAGSAVAGGAGHMYHSRKSSQASTGNPYGLSPFLGNNAPLFGPNPHGDSSARPITPPGANSSAASPPPPPSYTTAAGVGGYTYGSRAESPIDPNYVVVMARRAPTPPATRLPVVPDDDGLDVAAAERAAPGAAGTNRLQLLNPDDSTIDGHGRI